MPRTPSIFRPTTGDDLSGLTGLLATAFGVRPDLPFLRPEALRWKFWDPRADWTEPRSYVLENAQGITAHAGIWPVPLSPDGIRGVHMIDWASAAPGAGLALLEKLTEIFDFVYAIGGSPDTRKVLPLFGFQEHARQWKGAVPLHPVRQVLTHQKRDWKLAPRLARNAFHAYHQHPSPHPDWRPVQISAAEMILPQSSDARRCFPRPASFFGYLQGCPGVPFTFYSLRDQSREYGKFALSVVRNQARLAGVWLNENDVSCWTAAYLCIRNAAGQLPGANELAASGTIPGPSCAAAEQAGFRTGDSASVYLLDPAAKLAPSPEFQFHFCDDDSSFLDSGRVEYWT